MAGFCTWLVVSNAAFNPSYNPAGQYHAAFLLGGFVLGRRAIDGDALGSISRGALSFGLVLAAWAVYERTTGVTRPSALFETPATFAGMLNLLLAPMILAACTGRLGRPALLVAGALGIAILLAASRGAWIGLAAGALAMAVLARRTGLSLISSRMRWALGAGAAAFVAAWLLAGAIPFLFSMTEEASVRSSAARIGLYQLALASMDLQTLLLGNGYLSYFYILEQGRGVVPTYEAGTSYFAHNDYLQVLLELGLPGLVALIALAAGPAILVWRGADVLVEGQRKHLAVAAVGAGATMATHAFFDYPFYVPACLLVYGVCLGVVDAVTAPKPGGVAPPHAAALRRGGRAAVWTLGAWLLLAPLAAQAVSAYASHAWADGRARAAALGYGLAATLEPRDWRHHWHAGQFWLVQAEIGGRGAAADLADAAFARGFAANPRDARNLLGRIEVHRRLGDRLSAPAPRAVVLGWAREASRRLPNDPDVARERALLEAGKGAAR